MKTALITGTSTGLGYAIVKKMLSEGYHVFGSVRNREDADRLQSTLGQCFTPLLFDVTDTNAIKQAAKIVHNQLQNQTLDVLVNNAGIVIFGPLQHIPLDAVENMFDVNVKGLLNVTQVFLPLLGASDDRQGEPGRIINISSVSGKIAYPFIGAYAATKHAVEALSDAMRRELSLYGIKVSIIEPGVVKTALWDKLSQYPNYKETIYSDSVNALEKIMQQSLENPIKTEKIANAVFHASTAKRPALRYWIPNNPVESWIKCRLPQRILDNLFRKVLLLNPKGSPKDV